MDLAAWFLVDSFTVDQAARLWAGVDPAKNTFQLTAEEQTRIAPKKQMLVAAIMSGVLPAQVNHNAMRIIGNHDTSVVGRSDLEEFARTKQDFPPFLFDTLFPTGVLGQVVESKSSTDRTEAPSSLEKTRGGRPPEHDWDAITIEIIRVANMPDGLPETQARLVDHLLQWSGETLGREPPVSSVKARVSKIYGALGLSRKPSDA
jgi:hypothetical protein